MSPNLFNLSVASQTGNYEIIFKELVLELVNHEYFLCDSFLASQLDLPRERTIYVESAEKLKNLGQVESILISLSKLGMRKMDSLVVIGGGCLQDLGTLVSSLYMRGVKWTYVPTTLAAMGDSCIGGKSSINVGLNKNLIGNFYPPAQIIIDVRFCSTLPQLEVIAGLAEIIKIAYSRSSRDFDRSIVLIDSLSSMNDRNVLEQLVHLSLSAKKYFIEIDEFDLGVRKLLNFGHTFGHALESSTNYQIPHGVGVMVGMIAAVKHPGSSVGEAERVLQETCLKLLETVSEEIDQTLRDLDFLEFAKKIQKDKKNTPEDLVLILPFEGSLRIYHSPFANRAIEIAVSALRSAHLSSCSPWNGTRIESL